MVQAIPDGYTSVTPYIVCSDVAKAIEFYQRAFGAEELARMPGPDGKGVMHAEIQIGNGRIMMSEENPNWKIKSPTTLGGTPVSIQLYVEDCDRAFKRAVDAGATATMPPSDRFWGDRYSTLVDPFGHQWGIATHIQDLTPEQMQQGAQEFFKSMPGCG